MTPRMTKEDLEALKNQHGNFINNPDTSRGQKEDSRIILNLIAELDATREEVKNSREWAESQNKSANGWNEAWKEVDKERNELRALLEELNSRVVPGSTDIAYSLVLLKMERDLLKTENEQLKLDEKHIWEQVRHQAEQAIEARGENFRLKREIEILRQYGNKDCTAAADEVLAVEMGEK